MTFPFATMLMASAVAVSVPISTNYYSDLALQILGNEPANSTTGADSGPDAWTWTAVGNAKTSGGYLTFDGAGDYLTLNSDADDWNFLHNGARWAIEVTVKGRPTAASNIVLDTTGTSSSNVGAALWITSAGNVRLLIGRGVGGQPVIDYTSSFTVPNDGADHHIALEWNWGTNNTAAGALRVGIDSTRQDVVSRNNYQFSMADATYDLVIGAVATGAGGYYNGQFKNLRVWHDRHPYVLSANSTYTVLPYLTAGDVGVRNSDGPRFFPEAETTAAGRTWGAYLCEPRVIDMGGGVFHCFAMDGASHAPANGTKINRIISTDYGLHWSNPVTIASDATYACRNHAVGKDSSGNVIVVYRKYNGTTTIGVFYRTSADAFASETNITSLLTGTVPWNRGVQTNDGLMFTFYKANFAEVLYWNGSSFGTRRTIYDVTGTAPGYNEPTPISDGAGQVVWIARKDGTGNNDFAFYSSANAGATVTSLGEVQWTATTFTAASPIGLGIVGNDVVFAFGSRGTSYDNRYGKATKANFFANPKRILDGTETINSYPMHQTTGTEYDANYGYHDVVEAGAGLTFITNYEQARDTQNATRLWSWILAL